MLSNLPPAEACALLTRVLHTLQSLDRALALTVRKERPPVPLVPTPLVAEAPPKRRAALTIKLSDLQREGELARRRRPALPAPEPPTRSKPPSLRPKAQRRVREAEVIYRKNFKLVS